MPTRQEMLDTINMKIARTSHSDEGTGCFLPVTFDDVRYALFSEFRNAKFPKLIEVWWPINDPLDKQSSACICEIYNLLSYDK